MNVARALAVRLLNDVPKEGDVRALANEPEITRRLRGNASNAPKIRAFKNVVPEISRLPSSRLI
jgi:hypothetical protein